MSDAALRELLAERIADARRGDGHGAAGLRARRGRLPRRGLRRPRPAPAGLQRPALADAAPTWWPRSTAATSRPAPTSSRPTPSTRRRSRWPTTGCRRTSYADQPRRGDESPGGWPTRSRPGHARAPAVSSPAPSGPTNATASLSPDVNDPGLPRGDLRRSRRRLPRAGPRAARRRRPLLLAETGFDTLNLKAALFAIERSFAAAGRREVPVLASCYPNAGLPNEIGEYDQGPEEMAAILIGEFADEGWSTSSAAAAARRPSTSGHRRGGRPRPRGARRGRRAEPMMLSGLEPLTPGPTRTSIMVGERTNVTGSRASPS
jgi:hypothetical protein